MRATLAAVLCLTLPALPAAQQPPVQAAPPSSIGLPLPPIGLPLPPIGFGPSHEASPQTPSGSVPTAPAPRPDRSSRVFVFFGAPYSFGMDPLMGASRPGIAPTAPGAVTTAVTTSAVAEMGEATGWMRLQVEPQHVQIFVDGEYRGSAGDFDEPIDLRAGTRHVELRAAGYETLALDVRVAAGQTISYRGTLQRLADRRPPRRTTDGAPDAVPPTEPSAAPDPRPVPRSTFYLIPGCYLGNVPPDQVKLPPGCDLSRLITHHP